MTTGPLSPPPHPTTPGRGWRSAISATRLCADTRICAAIHRTCKSPAQSQEAEFLVRWKGHWPGEAYTWIPKEDVKVCTV